MRSAKGRAASAAFCARRSFEAATICIALVIFCVALVEAMRTRMSFKLAIAAADLWVLLYLPRKGGGGRRREPGWGSLTMSGPPPGRLWRPPSPFQGEDKIR